VEHLLAALVTANVTDVWIELDGAEVPLLDGSAQGWCEAIAEAGLTSLTSTSASVTPPVKSPEKKPEKPFVNGSEYSSKYSITTPLSIQQNDAFVVAMPSPELRFTYGIDFREAAIGQQWHTWFPQTESFETTIAPARTFGLAHQVAHLKAQGLIQGGSLENALVCDGDIWLNPPLRFANEPVRHKILDLVGDLSLLGTIPQAHYLAYKASHELHVALARVIDSSRSL
jgi:UDP-3-O-[3-hydroxymyristoyl] N-acetylglucosamine deacetylase